MAAETGPIERAVARALKDAPLLPRDAAASALARRYARAIDRVDQVDDDDAALSAVADIGPKLLAVLTALGMTPAGRSAKGGGAGAGPTVSGALDELRARRQQRAGRSGTD